MQSSAEARVLLAVLRKCDVAWKKQQQGGTRAFGGGQVPRFRRALVAFLPCPPSMLVSHLRTTPQPPHLLWAGFHQLAAFSPRQGAFRLGWACLLQGPLRAEPDLPWSPAALRRDAGQSPPAPRSGRGNSQGGGLPSPQRTGSSDPGRTPEEEDLLPGNLPDAHSFGAHLGRLLIQKGRLYKSWLAWSQDLLSFGDPWGGGFPLSRVACDLGRRSTTDFSPKRKALTSPPQGAHNERSATLAAGGSAAPRGGAWRKPASGLAPCRPNLAGRRAGRGPGPLPIAPTPAGIPPGALRARFRAGGPDPPAAGRRGRAPP